MLPMFQISTCLGRFMLHSSGDAVIHVWAEGLIA